MNCNFFLPLSFILLFILPASTTATSPMSYHGGEVLKGDLKLGLVWYGRVGRVQKNTIRSFIKSLNAVNVVQPSVATWWQKVESYQEMAHQGAGKIGVRVVNQASDTSYGSGKILTKDFIKPLITKATNGDKTVLAIIFSARDVTVDGLCMGRCGLHGVLDLHPYVIVGNPETECPQACGYPFVKPKQNAQGGLINPPSGNIGADAMVIAFAMSLAETVSNPFNTGVFQGPDFKSVGVAQTCVGIFGTGAIPEMNPGKFLINPKNGGAYNANGLKGKKFLLPGLWSTQTNSCWTLL